MNQQEHFKYHLGDTNVMLGDRVQVRLFLIMKRKGRVVYVPGVSPLHREMEHDGIRLLGISFDTGGHGGFWIEQSSGRVIKTVKFIERDPTPTTALPAEKDWE